MMTNDIDLDAIEAAATDDAPGYWLHPKVHALIAAVRSERARADAAETERDEVAFALEDTKAELKIVDGALDLVQVDLDAAERDRDSWKARALAAEPIAAAFEGVTAEDLEQTYIGYRFRDPSEPVPTMAHARVSCAFVRLRNAIRDSAVSGNAMNACNTGAAHEADLVYAAWSRCSCGAGLAYREGTGPGGCWWCSDLLLRGATEDHARRHHPQMPFVFYDILSERQPSANGHTTRPTLRAQDEPKRESLDCFICGAPWDSPGACQCGRREEPKLDPSDIVCDGCGVSEPEHAKYCGEPAYERQVDEDGRTAPDRCGEWVTRAEYEKREPNGGEP